MGKAKKRADPRGTRSRGTENRLAPPVALARHASSAMWNLWGDGAIPDILESALLDDKELQDAMSVDQALVVEKCQRLYAAWEFLDEAQRRSKRDPKDGALLVSDPLRDFGRARIKTEIHRSAIDDSAILVATEWEDPDPEPWQPSSFPRQSPEEIAAYPKRPKKLAHIPPFFAENVHAWREVLKGQQQMLEVGPPPRNADAPKPPPPPDPKVVAEMLERAVQDARDRLIDATVANTTGGDTPLVSQALVNLSMLTLEDITRQTKVPLPTGHGDLLSPVEALFFHGAWTVVLDNKGEPTTLRGRLTYPILVAEPGSRMKRHYMSSGLYVSVQRFGYSTFRVDGSRVSKVLFGGVGGFTENHGYGIVTAHPLHERIAAYLESRGRFTYVASVTAEGGRKPGPLTLDTIEQKGPVLAAAAMPFLVKEILARIPRKGEELVALLKEVAVEVIREIIIDEIRERVIAFVIKKIGARLIPFVNVAVALLDLFDDEANARIRHAIACAMMGVRAKSVDEMTIAAKVMAKIMADEFGDRVIEVLASRARALKKKAGGATTPDDKSPTDSPPATDGPSDPRPATDAPAAAASPDGTASPAASGSTASDGTPDAPGAVSTPGAPGAPAAEKAPPPRDAPAAMDAPAPKDGTPAVDAPAAPDVPSKIDPPSGKPPMGLAGSLPPDSGARARRPRDDDEDAKPGGAKEPDDDPTATRARAIDDPTGDGGTADPGTGHRVGTDRVGVAPAPPINRIGEDAIGVSDRDATPVTTNRTALTSPGRPAFPDRSSRMGIANRTIGEPVATNIGGADVVSRHPDVLVGARRDHHREDVLAVIANDPNHPMRPMLDETSVGSDAGPVFVSGPYRYGNMDLWQQNPQDWQSGHARSGRAGDADVLVVQTRYENQRSSADLERTGDVTMDGAFVIGGIAVDKQSARQLRDAGYIRMTEAELEACPTLDFDRE